MELNPIDERVLVYRPSVGGTLTQRLTVEFAGSCDVLPGDRRERYKLDGVNLNLTEADPVAAALLDPRPLPQSDRQRDVSGENVVAQFAAELHSGTLAGEKQYHIPFLRRGSPQLPLGAVTVSKDLVFTTLYDGVLIAVNRTTGAIVYRRQPPTSANSPIATAGNTAIVPAGGPATRTGSGDAQVMAYTVR